MIKQNNIGLNSRSEANPYNEDGFLPLITAPMYSVVNETNYQVFLDNKIQVCLPRNVDPTISSNDKFFIAYSLQEFQSEFINNRQRSLGEIKKVCIDTANGNIHELHNAIRKAKEIHGSNLIIMAGNVASAEAFIGLAKTGVDYIRVGIGGGGGCNTTSNTGVGQENLESLITQCWIAKHNLTERLRQHEKNWKEFEEGKRIIHDTKEEYFNRDFYIEQLQINKIKIVADGISSYIKQCEKEYGFNDNGYAAINKLLFAGADLVMVGKLFAQCIESAGEKAFKVGQDRYETQLEFRSATREEMMDRYFKMKNLYVKYSGMSTQEEQAKYKNVDFKIHVIDSSEPYTVILDTDQLKIGHILETKLSDKSGNVYRLSIKLTSNSENVTNSSFKYTYESKTLDNFPLGTVFKLMTINIKPSEGSVNWIPVRWTLNEWLNGSDKQDEAPYLMGWINSIKSAMAYTGKTKL